MTFARSWILLGLFLLASAVPGQGQEKKPMLYESAFYPLRVGSQWRYQSTAGDAPPQVVTVTAERAEPYEYKSTPANKQEISESIVRYRLKKVSGAKELHEYVAVLKDGVYRFSSADKEITPPLRFLKLPLTKGETWTVNSVSENVQLTGTFTCDDASVKVPAGQFQAKHVWSKDFQVGSEKMIIEYWFARDVGIVKQHVHVVNSDEVLELEDFRSGK